MSEKLTKHELWVIQVYFGRRGFTGAHRINDIVLALQHLGVGNSQGHRDIDSLISKQILSLSPDGESAKFTDYGVELYRAHQKAQTEWESQPIIKVVATLHSDEILIRAGERFRANRVLREILSLVRKEIAITDTYVGPLLFDHLESLGPKIPIRLLTLDAVLASKPAAKAAMNAYNAFKEQYKNIEMRTIVTIHDRYILWDGAHGYHLGHSIKDLGTKDVQLNLLKTGKRQWELFEQRWQEATPIP